ncbi:MAG: cbb3-type cytochrome c oxidase subunit 3 [Rickettsiales bacterium]
MKEMFASANAGIIGLLFFFILFSAILVWAYSPSRRQDIEKLKNIPFDDEDDNGRA